MITLDSILEEAPLVKGGEKWAIFGLRCLWWSSFPEESVFWAGGPLPRCPHCGGILDQKPLSEFIKEAKADPDLYGPAGIKALVAAYRAKCRRIWELYI